MTQKFFVLHALKAIGYLVFAGGLQLYAAEDSVDFFKNFAASPRPTNLLVRFTVESAMGRSGELKGYSFSVVNGKIEMIALEKPSVWNFQFIVTEKNFVAVTSLLPIEVGFQSSAMFSAWGIADGAYWSLNPKGQIRYESAPTTVAKAIDNSFMALLETHMVLNLGVTKNGPLIWSGNKFQGKLLDLGNVQQPTTPNSITGELVLSNGLPATVFYKASGGTLLTKVSYHYTSKSPSTFPSEIKMERIREVDGTNQYLSTKLYRITEFRPNATTEDLSVFDPHHYLRAGNAFAGAATDAEKLVASNAMVAAARVTHSFAPSLPPPLAPTHSQTFRCLGGLETMFPRHPCPRLTLDGLHSLSSPVVFGFSTAMPSACCTDAASP